MVCYMDSTQSSIANHTSRLGIMETIENPSWPKEYRPRYTRGNLWQGCLSLKPYRPMLTKQYFTEARLLGKVGNWHKIGTTTNAQTWVCMRQLYHFKLGTGDKPVETLEEMEDLHVKLNNAGISVYNSTLYPCFVSALPAAEYSLEIRELNLKQVYDRNEIINLVRSKYETLRSSFGKSKGSSKSLTLVGKGGSGYGGKGGREHGGRDRSGKGKRGNDRSNGGAGKANVLMRCLRCKAAGHYGDSCTAKLCEGCGGRRYESSKRASPADMDGSPAEGVFAMVGDPREDAVETTSF